MGRIGSVNYAGGTGDNRILEKKGLIAQDEILDEVSKLKLEMDEKIRRMGCEN